MASIGTVTKTATGSFKGQLRTLSIRTESVANTRKTTDTHPDYRVVAGDVEIGAGWNRHSDISGRDYVSLSLSAPEFGPRRIYANLGRLHGGNADQFALIWMPAD